MKYKGTDQCVFLALSIERERFIKREILGCSPTITREKQELLLFHNRVRADFLKGLLDRCKPDDPTNPNPNQVVLLPPMSAKKATDVWRNTNLPHGNVAPQVHYDLEVMRLQREHTKVSKDENGEKKVRPYHIDPAYHAAIESLNKWLKEQEATAQERSLEFRKFEAKYARTIPEVVEEYLFLLGVLDTHYFVPILKNKDMWPTNERIHDLQLEYGTPVFVSIGVLNELDGNDEVVLINRFLKPMLKKPGKTKGINSLTEMESSKVEEMSEEIKKKINIDENQS